VKSRPGEGTEFQIVLPRVLSDEADVQVGTPVQEISPGAGSILLVEDDDALRKMAGEMLRSIGYHVQEAASGEEALAVCSQSRTPIPLLVTDMIMPGMNGRTLAERLRHSQPTLKVLYISGYTENILDLHGPLGNGTAFLQKPFTVAALATHVRDLLNTPA
jgi:two-component system cell cycle sensor histidine kinase/response regulator CckA